MELRPSLFCLLFCLLYFFLPPFEDNGLLFWVPDVPLLAFRSCFVEFTQHFNVLLMNLLGRKWSPCPIPPPSSTPVFLGFPGGSADKESACNAGDQGLIPGLGRYPGEGKGYPLQYCGLENSPWRHKELDMTERFSLSRHTNLVWME